MDIDYMIIPGLPKKLTFKIIEAEVCDFLGIDSIQGETRKREVVKARQFCHYFAVIFFNEPTKHKKSEFTLKKIGEYFGGKDHATVSHSVKTVKNEIFSNSEYKKEIEELNKIFKNYETN